MNPLLKSQRIISIDALRGFALAGVVLVHMVEQYIAGPAPEGFMEGVNGLPDQIVQGLLQFFFSGKFFALFSILFGLSLPGPRFAALCGLVALQALKVFVALDLLNFGEHLVQRFEKQIQFFLARAMDIDQLQ